MSRLVIFFLLVVTPLLACLLALLGVATIPANPLGWFLILVGVVYSAGVIIIYSFRKERFWEMSVEGKTTQEERGDRSFWFITLGMCAVFYTSPLEFLYLPALLPRSAWLSSIGLVLVALGVMLFIWARLALRKEYSGHLSVSTGHTLVQDGPYALIRHPAYAGFLSMALGISLGYSSLVGFLSVLTLLLPGLVYRMNVEEKLLIEYFGESYRRYARAVKRIIPGVW